MALNTIKDVTGRDSITRPDPIEIIEKYYTPGTKSYDYIIAHGLMVAEKALEVSKNVHWLPPGEAFLREASMLHDIGIYLTDAPHLGCFGKLPYIAHGYLGREILEREGLPLHALVCERHVGVGLTKKEIIEKNLPLPHRNMFPITPEEEVICFADKFFPVTPERMLTRQSLADVRAMVAVYGEKSLWKFNCWVAKFLEVEK